MALASSWSSPWPNSIFLKYRSDHVISSFKNLWWIPRWWPSVSPGASWKCILQGCTPDARARNLHLTNPLVILGRWHHITLGETLAYSRKLYDTNVQVCSVFSVLSASLFSNHLIPTDLDLTTFPWRTHCLLSLLHHLAMYAVLSARNVLAPLFNLINYLLPIYPSRYSSKKTSCLKHFLILINLEMSHMIPTLFCG